MSIGFCYSLPRNASILGLVILNDKKVSITLIFLSHLTIDGHFIHRMFPGKIVKMTGTPHFAWRHLVNEHLWLQKYIDIARKKNNFQLFCSFFSLLRCCKLVQDVELVQGVEIIQITSWRIFRVIPNIIYDEGVDVLNDCEPRGFAPILWRIHDLGFRLYHM